VNVRQTLFTFLCGLAGGLLFYFLHLPLPWILGPAAAMITMNAIRPNSTFFPLWISELGFMAIAYVLGRSITAQTGQLIANDLPWMILIGVVWIVVCFFIGLAFAKAARLHEATGVLGCMPGGLSQMVLLADDVKGADPGTVAVIQTARLVLVLYTVPFLATLWSNDQSYPIITMVEGDKADLWSPIYGLLLLPLVPLAAWIAKRIRLPAGEFAGPAVCVGALSAFGCPWPDLPDSLMAVAQLVIGIYIGGRVRPRLIITNKRLAPLAFIIGALLVAIASLTSWILSMTTSDTIVTWFLALGPGRLGEMAATALVLEADVAQVTSYQMARLFMILIFAPPMLRGMLSLHRKYYNKN